MRIILVNRFFFPDESATSQLLSDLAFSLAESGYQVTAICSRQSYSDPSTEYPQTDTINGVEIVRVGGTRFGRSGAGRLADYLSFFVGALVVVWRLVRRDDLLVVKTDPPLLSVPMSWIANIRHARQVNWLQDLFPEVARELGVRGLLKPVFQVLRWLRNQSLRGAVMNVAIGERMRSLLLANGVNESRVRVVHNWSDGESIKPLSASANRLRKAWELEGKFVVGYSGNMGRAHGFETLLESILLLSRDSRIHFLFIGEGRQLTTIQDFKIKHDLQNISMQPFQPRSNLGLSLTVPDLHVVTLRPGLEGLIVPSKVYGALAAGVPVLFIGDPDGEIPDIIARDYSCGIALREGDAQGVAAGILHLANNEAVRREYAGNARANFERLYDRKVALREWSSLIETSSAKVDLR